MTQTSNQSVTVSFTRVYEWQETMRMTTRHCEQFSNRAEAEAFVSASSDAYASGQVAHYMENVVVTAN